VSGSEGDATEAVSIHDLSDSLSKGVERYDQNYTNRHAAAQSPEICFSSVGVDDTPYVHSKVRGEERQR
jgi:hypothetical protein